MWGVNAYGRVRGFASAMDVCAGGGVYVTCGGEGEREHTGDVHGPDGTPHAGAVQLCVCVCVGVGASMCVCVSEVGGWAGERMPAAPKCMHL